jgi:hypothetical protein
MKLLVYVVQKYENGSLGDNETPLVNIELPEKTGISNGRDTSISYSNSREICSGKS